MAGRSGGWISLLVVGTDRDTERSGMRIGAVFPQTEIGDDPEVIRVWAQAVQELGYRQCWPATMCSAATAEGRDRRTPVAAASAAVVVMRRGLGGSGDTASETAR
jgi:hypothetical protein